MLLIPAIDLRDGKVVRLFQGATDEKVYSQDPGAVAARWQAEGAQMLHVVDLDGAFTGTPKNLAGLQAIRASVGIPLEFGGGVRDEQTVRLLLENGVQRVILGTRAAEDLDFVAQMVKHFKERVIVSIDARQGKVQTQGWKATRQDLDASDFARQLKAAGMPEIIYTDTQRDGAMSGPNIPALSSMLDKTGLRIVASGGVSKPQDLVELKKLEPRGLSAVIIGKALYEGTVDLKKALATV